LLDPFLVLQTPVLAGFAGVLVGWGRGVVAGPWEYGGTLEGTEEEGAGEYEGTPGEETEEGAGEYEGTLGDETEEEGAGEYEGTLEDETEGEVTGEGSEESPSAKLTTLGPATTKPSRGSLQMLGHSNSSYIPGRLVSSLDDGMSAPPFFTLTCLWKRSP